MVSSFFKVPFLKMEQQEEPDGAYWTQVLCHKENKNVYFLNSDMCLLHQWKENQKIHKVKRVNNNHVRWHFYAKPSLNGFEVDKKPWGLCTYCKKITFHYSKTKLWLHLLESYVQNDRIILLDAMHQNFKDVLNLKFWS